MLSYHESVRRPDRFICYTAAMRLCLLTRLFIFFLPWQLQAAQAQEPAQDNREYPVREISDGDTLTLDNGVVVRLAGLQAPKLALGRPGFRPWPLAEQARETLIELTQDHSVRLHYGGARQDRYRRTLAHLYRSGDGLWIQGEMLRRGMARVYTFSDNRALAAEMLTLEQEARAAHRGLWSLDFYAVRRPENLHGVMDTFQLVEGRVLKFAKISDYIFLNFGTDYKTDFTAVIERRDWPHFAAAADPKNYPGKNVRVRGWLQYWNGPMVRVSHPEQIEVLE
ncbi:MAG: thermonuclease family protein [Alphaproteobacteria bacterium]|nr:thermonuclease family protein [Alphaproteobacteria bacterium]